MLLFSIAGVLALFGIRYLIFAYQGIVDSHVPALRRRAFDVPELIGPDAVSFGWKQLVIALLLLVGAAFLLFLGKSDLFDDEP